jgi:hypothetical protein
MTAVVLILLVSGAYAQQADEAFGRLLRARSLRCDLRMGTQASWDGGTPKLERSTFGEGSRVTFDSIDTKAGKARLIANAGAGDVQVLATVAGLTFVEQTAFGNLNFTTVFANYDSAVSRQFIAVASRHQNINGPFPSQYHGTCSVLE